MRMRFVNHLAINLYLYGLRKYDFWVFSTAAEAFEQIYTMICSRIVSKITIDCPAGKFNILERLTSLEHLRISSKNYLLFKFLCHFSIVMTVTTAIVQRE